jgi:hypothetical protein
MNGSAPAWHGIGSNKRKQSAAIKYLHQHIASRGIKNALFSATANASFWRNARAWRGGRRGAAYQATNAQERRNNHNASALALSTSQQQQRNK